MFSIKGKIVRAFGLDMPNLLVVLNGGWSSVFSIEMKIVGAFGFDLPNPLVILNKTLQSNMEKLIDKSGVNTIVDFDKFKGSIRTKEKE